MKKILFLFSIISLSLFTACSSDSDSFSPSPDNLKSYPISFNVANPISINGKELLKSGGNGNENGKMNSLNLLVYDEIGKLVTEFKYNNLDNEGHWKQEDGSARLNLSLPEGTYNFAFYTMSDGSINDDYSSYITFTLIPQDYTGDTNFFNYYFSYQGTYSYYESLKMTVKASDEVQKSDISLKPMWSNLNIAITDAQTFDTPEGTDAVQFEISPLYVGFKLDSKLAVNKAPKDFATYRSDYTGQRESVVALDTVRKESSFVYKTCIYQTLPENGDLAINLKYLNTKNQNDTIVLETRALKVPKTVIENGYNYNIKGTLGKKESNQAFSITLSEFSDKEINF